MRLLFEGGVYSRARDVYSNNYGIFSCNLQTFLKTASKSKSKIFNPLNRRCRLRRQNIVQNRGKMRKKWQETNNNHGKKGDVYLVENARWIYAKCGICLHLLVFTDRKIQGFRIVLLSVNLSIRSIIRNFPYYGESQKTPVFWNLPVC